MLNLSVLLEDSASRFGTRLAFSSGSTDFTFHQVNVMANQLANALKKLGIREGEKVAMTCPNCIWFPVIYYAVLKTGAVMVPLNILLKSDEIKYHLQDSQAAFYFCFEGTPEMPVGKLGWNAFDEVPGCRDFVLIGADKPAGERSYTLAELMAGEDEAFDSCVTDAEDTAVIIYTSGTTGRPKGAELTHINLYCNAVLSAELFSLSQTDVQLIVLPLFHVFGMTVLMNAGLYRAAHGILLPRFDAKDVIENINKHQVSIFAGVPTMYWVMASYIHPEITDQQVGNALRICISGGASLPLAVLEGFEQRFSVQVQEGYGMSEGSPVVTFNDPKIGRKPGSIGTPVWGVCVKIIDQEGQEVANGEKGELIYKGHNVMKGYFRRPDETREVLRNGWLHSGDIAIKDGDGFYFIVDRLKDMIIRGGMNIYPREVEEVMMKHPAVSLAAVVGVPDDKLGEEVKAFIVLKENQQVAEREIIDWCRAMLASYKCPRYVEFRAVLPLTATGKLLKKELKNNL